MSSNKNLFYSLYSKSNNVVSAGYTCSSAIDETDTSFDITTNSIGGSAGAITDSNGDTLSSIDLTSIHVPGITQYNTETRILQPHSCYVLQGQEYGLAYAEYYYMIPKRVSDTNNYQYYISCDFDVVYNNFNPKRFHIHTDPDGHTSVTKQINDELKNSNILVSTNICEQFSEFDKTTHQYLHFISQKEGYFYYIDNLRITINFKSETYPYSPFNKDILGLKQFMYDVITKYHPTVNDEEYDPETYNVDCELYSWLIHNYDDAVTNLDSFNRMIEYLYNAINATTPEDEQYWLTEANIAIQNTVYDADLFNNYNITNIETIRDIIIEIKNKLVELDEYYNDFYWLHEDRFLRIPLMKYPNGAFRGIVLVPDWPDNEIDYSSLWINHIKSTVKLFVQQKNKQYIPKLFGVLSNATLVKEEKVFRHMYSDFGSIEMENQVTTIPDGFSENENMEQANYAQNNTDNYLEPYRPNTSVEDDLVWMGQNYYSKKNNIIGIFRYMQYVNDNKLWDKVGEAYMIIGNEDNVQSNIYNLPTSLLVYNPNDVPIRIKYMIFS